AFRPGRTPSMFTDISNVDGTSQVSKMITFLFHDYGSSSVAYPVDGMHNGDEQYSNYMISSNWAAGNTTYTYSTQPNPSYPHTHHGLTDGTLGGTSSLVPYVGWSGVGSVTVTFNLGAVKEIKSVMVHALTGTTASIKYPTSITVTVSNNGSTYRSFGNS